MKVKGSRGFTLVEVILVLVILGVLTGLIAPGIVHFMNQAKITKHNNIARTVFLAAQSQLTNMKNSGTLTDVSEFSVVNGSLVIKGGYLASSRSTAGRVDASLVNEPDDINKEAMYYLTLSKNGEDDSFLLSLLSKVDIAKDVIEGTVCIEFNAGTGNVMSAFYSDTFDKFVYDGSDSENNLMKHRTPSTKLGVYAVDTTGLMHINISEPKITLTDGLHDDGKGIANALYCEAYIVDESANHTIEICVADGAPYLDENGLPYAVTFTGNSIFQKSFSTDHVFQYQDLQASDHAGSVIDGYADDIHIMFKSNELTDPNGGTVMSHRKVVWVLDLLDDNKHGIAFENSIYVKYPGIEIDDIIATLSYSGSGSSFSSDMVNSYYAFETEDSYLIEDARHFSNMRYVGTNPASKIKAFVQTEDIDLLPVYNFAPLNWIPDGGNIRTDGVFEADFTGEKDGESSYLISNVYIESDDQNTGVFGVIENSSFKGIALKKAEIKAKKGGNAGAIAGIAVDSNISRAAVSANVTVTGGTFANAGGLVGLTENSNINLSYNSGGFHTEQYGAVNVAGNYSGTVNLGGIVGHVSSGSVSSSYNNARVGVSAMTEGSGYQLENPVFDSIVYSDLKNISTGGVVGRNDGVVQNCYATNFVAEYYTALQEANSSAIVGLSTGECKNCFAVYNGIPYDVIGENSDGKLLSKDELKVAAPILGTSFEPGNLTASGGAEYHLPSNYPYPIISSNLHRFEWENINSSIGFDLIGDVYFQTSKGRIEAKTSAVHNNYVEVNLLDKSAVNYLGNLRIDVKYRGFSPLFARVKLDFFRVNRVTGEYLYPGHEDFKYTEYVQPSNANQLAWFSRFLLDESFYYATALRPPSETTYTTLPFVLGAADSFAPASVDSALYIKADVSAVEPLRFDAFWNIKKIPWR